MVDIRKVKQVFSNLKNCSKRGRGVRWIPRLFGEFDLKYSVINYPKRIIYDGI